MPSPFPGMDPYLEVPAFWRNVHGSFMNAIAAQLNAALPPQYAAAMEERVYLIQPEGSIYPDISVFQRRQALDQALDKETDGGAAVAVADEPVRLTAYPNEVHEPFIQIIALQDEERLVTTIEVLSYANKSNAGEGRDLYVANQQKLLRGDSHLLEIDLLRQGQHTVAPPHHYIEARYGAWDYLISLHRHTARWEYELWLNSVRNRLPIVRVPLANGDADIALDLQAAFNRCYDDGPYSRRVDYARDARLPLEGDDAAWADALLREKGLRS